MSELPCHFFVSLLHDRMIDKQEKMVTTSLTLLDIHDIARSSRTYGISKFFIQHSSPVLRDLAHTLTSHWQTGYGATYNPDRKEALSVIQVVTSLKDIEDSLRSSFRRVVKVATSAKAGGNRCTFHSLRSEMHQQSDTAYLLMLGTGWGMSDELLEEADLFLEPINGPTPYNHLSVRSACAIMLDRLCSPQN